MAPATVEVALLDTGDDLALLLPRRAGRACRCLTRARMQLQPRRFVLEWQVADGQVERAHQDEVDAELIRRLSALLDGEGLPLFEVDAAQPYIYTALGVLWRDRLDASG